jgi:protein-disulfide isomerase
MKRILLAMCVLSACSKSDDKVAERISTLEKRVDALEKRPAAAQRPQPPRPDPNVTYFIPVNADDPVRGAANAKVTVVEAFDFACPWCARSNGAIEAVLDKYKDSVRVVSKYFVVHPDVATLPAMAACAAGVQGKGAAMEQAIWASAWKLDPPPKFEQENLAQAPLEGLASKLGLDIDRFKKDMSGPTCKAMVERHYKEVTAIGVNATPAFYINGKFYAGQRTPEAFGAAIEAEIQKADAALKTGVKLPDYYGSLMASAKKTL